MGDHSISWRLQIVAPVPKNTKGQIFFKEAEKEVREEEEDQNPSRNAGFGTNIVNIPKNQNKLKSNSKKIAPPFQK